MIPEWQIGFESQGCSTSIVLHWKEASPEGDAQCLGMKPRGSTELSSGSQSYAKCVLGTSYIRKSNRSERKMKNKMSSSPCRFIRYSGPGTRYLGGEPDD